MSEQPSLFPNDSSPLPDVPTLAANVALSVLKFSSGQVSPAQKRFNQLLRQTETLASKIEAVRALADSNRPLFSQILTPLEQQRTALMRDMALWLGERLKRKGLTARQQDCAREILCDIAASLAMAGDASMQELHDAHSDESLEEQEKAEAARMKMFMEGMLGEEIGDDEAAFDTLDELMRASMAKMQAQASAEQEVHAQRQNKRKKSATQLKAEAEAQDANGALRTLYRQLASALHPDRETDPHEQLRKTALMKEANAAYERRDLLALLHLQMRADLVDGEQVANLAKEKLAAMTALLKERVNVLRRELFQIEQLTKEEFDLPIYSPLSAASIKRHLVESERDLREEIAMMQHDLQQVQDDKNLKRWLRQQQQDSLDKQVIFAMDHMDDIDYF
ncbi:MAG: heat shock protein DnaJ domain-containing protein [Comamonadaceae bacterium]|nr:MAG: heat shock protein DnaJ domain-containing protein [Comamonadaceae bacterium]